MNWTHRIHIMRWLISHWVVLLLWFASFRSRMILTVRCVYVCVCSVDGDVDGRRVCVCVLSTRTQSIDWWIHSNRTVLGSFGDVAIDWCAAFYLMMLVIRRRIYTFYSLKWITIDFVFLPPISRVHDIVLAYDKRNVRERMHIPGILIPKITLRCQFMEF